MIRFLWIFIFLSSCSSVRPTPYQKEKKKEGYRDSTLEDLFVVSFKGNHRTKPKRAQQFAEFRAIERCRKLNKHANIIDIFDKNIQKEIIRTSGSSFGPSSFGMYPYYSRHSSFGFGVGYNTIDTQSWKETLTFSVVEVYYKCEATIFRPKILFQELSAEKMKHLVKDVKGALQVEKNLEGGPNADSFQEGDIILKAQGRRVQKVYELIKIFDSLHKVIETELLRDGARLKLKMSSIDVTHEIQEAEEKIIQKVCKEIEKKNISLCLTK